MIKAQAPQIITSYFNEANYNGLLSPEEANKILHQNGLQGGESKDRCLKELNDLYRKCGVCYYMGIKLLHRHWWLNPGEFILEKTEVEEDETNFISKPTKATDVTVPYAPYCWHYTGSTFEPSEYSTDPCVLEYYKQITAKHEFFIEFLEITKKYGFEHVLVPAITSRKIFEDLIKASKFYLIEKNSASDASSVVQVRKEKPLSTKKMMRTGWPTGDNVVNPYCYYDSWCELNKYNEHYHVGRHY